MSEVSERAVFPAQCPSRELLDHVVGKWGVLLVVSLSEGSHRWTELRRRAEGISEKMLAQTLKTLAADGLVERHQLPVMPPHVEYRLTPAGEELARVMVPLVQWATRRADQMALDSGAA